MPILSGFLPIPLAMMIPFMGAQSLVLGKAFGEGFQYGKRKISAMTNEEFNRLTPSDIANNSRKELQEMIPSLKASITDMREFQTFIVHELIETVKQLPSDVFSGVTGQGRGTPAGDAFDLTASAFGLPKAFADTGKVPSGGGTIQKFADDYEREALALGFKLLLQIVKTFGTRTDIPIEKRVGYLNAFKKLEQIEKDKFAARDTPDESIAKTTVKGSVVQQIATMYQTIVNILNGIKAVKSGSITSTVGKAARIRFLEKQFFTHASKYNIFVAVNRKPGLQIDTAKSLKALTPIAKI